MISYKGAPRTTLARINLLGVTFIAAWHTTLPFVALYAQSLGALRRQWV